MEHRSLESGGPRIKFRCSREDPSPSSSSSSSDHKLVSLRRALSDGLRELVRTKAAPVGPDGKLLGNCACLGSIPGPLDGEAPRVLVSRSGRSPNDPLDLDGDFACVTSFDSEGWEATYQSSSEKTKPSSDTPLHWYSLVQAAQEFGWQERPKFVLHGHTFATEADAAALGVPISVEETMFSTKEDVEALRQLYRDHPYPANKCFIRNKHGFLILAQTMEEAVLTLRGLIVLACKR